MGRRWLAVVVAGAVGCAGAAGLWWLGSTDAERPGYPGRVISYNGFDESLEVRVGDGPWQTLAPHAANRPRQLPAEELTFEARIPGSGRVVESARWRRPAGFADLVVFNPLGRAVLVDGVSAAVPETLLPPDPVQVVAPPGVLFGASRGAKGPKVARRRLEAVAGDLSALVADLRLRGENDRALGLIRAELTVDATDEVALALLVEVGGRARAEAELRRLRTAWPGLVEVHRALQDVAADRDALLAEYTALAAARPDDAAAVYLLARLQSGDAALASFERAAALDPGARWPHLGLAHALAGVGRWAESERHLAAWAGDDDPEAWVRILPERLRVLRLAGGDVASLLDEARGREVPHAAWMTAAVELQEGTTDLDGALATWPEAAGAADLALIAGDLHRARDLLSSVEPSLAAGVWVRLAASAGATTADRARAAEVVPHLRGRERVWAAWLGLPVEAPDWLDSLPPAGDALDVSGLSLADQAARYAVVALRDPTDSAARRRALALALPGELPYLGPS